MKKRICLFLALLITLSVSIAFASESVFGTPWVYEGRAEATVLPDGNLLLTGRYRDDHETYVYTIRPSAEKNGAFSQIYQNAPSEGRFLDILPRTDGSFFVAEAAYASDMHGENILSFKLFTIDAEGERVWEKEMSALRGHIVCQWQLSPASGDELFFVLTSPYPDDPALNLPPQMILLDKDGGTRWDEVYAEILDFYITDISAVSDGYLFCGISWKSGDRIDMIGKIGKQGNLLWTTQLTEEKMATVTGIVPAEDDGAFVFGFAEADGKMRNKAWRYAADGELLWTREYADISGVLFRNAVAHGDMILVALDTLGNGVSFAIIDWNGNFLSAHRYGIEPDKRIEIPKVLANGGKAYIAFAQSERVEPQDSVVYGVIEPDTVVLPLLLDEMPL